MSEEPTPKIPLHQWTHTGKRVLFVRRCTPDMRSHGGFVWPKSGPVEAPDWRDDTNCGGGLHGWPWGIGIGIGSEILRGDIFQVVSVESAEVRSIEFGKSKFRCGEVVLSGSLAEAMLYTMEGRIAWVKHNSDSSASTSGDSSSASTSGDFSSASTSGNYSSAAISGEKSTIDISASSVGAIAAAEFSWVVRLGAVVVQRWREPVEGNSESFAYLHKLLDSVALGLQDGRTYKIIRGEVQA